MLKVEFGLKESADNEGGLGVAAVWFVFKGQGLSGELDGVDERCAGALKRALRASRFEGAREDVLEVLAPAGVGVGRIVLVGAGEAGERDELAIEQAAARAYRAVSHSGAQVLQIDVAGLGPQQAARAAFGVCLAAYRFDKYRTRQKPKQRPSIGAVRVIGAPVAARRLLRRRSCDRDQERGQHSRPGKPGALHGRVPGTPGLSASPQAGP